MASTNHERVCKALERARAIDDGADSAKAGFTYDQHVIDQLGQLIATCGGITAAADKLHLRPSTVRKIINRIPISEPTRDKFDQAFGSSAGHTTCQHPSPSLGQDPQRDKLRSFIDGCGGVEPARVRLGINRSTMKKIMKGLPVSNSTLQKIQAILHGEAASSDRISEAARARLEMIHLIYESIGNYEAVGRKIGLSRKHVKALLITCSSLGLFKYEPRPYSDITTDQLIADIAKYTTLQEVAVANNISWRDLRHLLITFGIPSSEIKSHRSYERRRSRCIEEYSAVANALGHHPTTIELGSHLYLYQKIRRLWGSLDAFWEELDIPQPPGDKPFFPTAQNEST